jgi:hypothetical protein
VFGSHVQCDVRLTGRTGRRYASLSGSGCRSPASCAGIPAGTVFPAAAVPCKTGRSVDRGCRRQPIGSPRELVPPRFVVPASPGGAYMGPSRRCVHLEPVSVGGTQRRRRERTRSRAADGRQRRPSEIAERSRCVRSSYIGRWSFLPGDGTLRTCGFCEEAVMTDGQPIAGSTLCHRQPPHPPAPLTGRHAGTVNR